MFSRRDTTTAGLLTPCWYLEKPVGVMELLAVAVGETVGDGDGSGGIGEAVLLLVAKSDFEGVIETATVVEPVAVAAFLGEAVPEGVDEVEADPVGGGIGAKQPALGAIATPRLAKRPPADATAVKKTLDGILSHALVETYRFESVVTYTIKRVGNVSRATPTVSRSEKRRFVGLAFANQMGSGVSHEPACAVPANLPRCTVLPSGAPRTHQKRRLPSLLVNCV